MFREEVITFPQSGAPGGYLAKFLVIVSSESECTPAAEPSAFLDRHFEDGLAWQIAFGGSEEFNAHLEWLLDAPVHAPLDIESHPGPMFRMLPQFDLIRIAFEKTRRQRVASFQVEESGEYFDDATGSGLSRQREREQAREHQRKTKAAHELEIAATCWRLNKSFVERGKKLL